MNHQQIRQPATPWKGTVSACTKCGQRTYVAPLMSVVGLCSAFSVLALGMLSMPRSGEHGAF